MFPNSTHDTWLTRHYRENPSVLEDHIDKLKHISGQMQNFAKQGDHRLRLHDVSKLPFNEGLDSLGKMADNVAAEMAAKFNSHVYRPSSKTEEVLKNPSGTSWFNIKEPADGNLGALLGHCGNTGSPHPEDELHYLANSHTDKNGKPYHEPSNVFIMNGGYLGEMKGKFNRAPDKETHEDVVNFLLHPDVKGIIGGGYLANNNFMLSHLTPEQQQKVLNEKPNIEPLNTNSKLNPDNFPETFADEIHGHNKAVNAINTFSPSAENIVQAYKDGSIGRSTLAEIMSHPKFNKMFDEKHISALLDMYLDPAHQNPQFEETD